MKRILGPAIVLSVAGVGAASADDPGPPPVPSYHCEAVLDPWQTGESEVCREDLGPGEHHVEVAGASLLSGSFVVEAKSADRTVWSVRCSVRTGGLPYVDRHEDCVTAAEGAASTSWLDLDLIDQHTADFTLVSEGLLTLRVGPGDGTIALSGN